MKKEVIKMKINWKLLGMSFLKGLGIAFFAFLLSGDNSAMGLGLLVGWLNYKLDSKKLE